MRISTQSFLGLCCFFVVFCFAQIKGQTTASTPPTVIDLDGRQQRHLISALDQDQIIVINNLIPGETYSIIVPNDPALENCQPVISIGGREATLLQYDPVLHQLDFVAVNLSASFKLAYGCPWVASNPPRHYISLTCNSCFKTSVQDYMKALKRLDDAQAAANAKQNPSSPTDSNDAGFAEPKAKTESAPAPQAVSDIIQIEQGSVEELVRDVLIGGNCFDLTNISFQGNGGQFGRFAGGLTNVGFANGMIMATGDVSVAVGPNDADGASGGYGSATNDGDLSQLANGGAVYDAASVEFDFTPTQGTLTFEYVFASEEYCEFVGTQYNDVFGFFISGPGITGPFGGAQNIASIGPGQYVAINTINHTSNAGLYVNNTPAGGSLCGQNPSNLPSVNELQFDGYTRRLVASASVIPCSTYHIKLAIGDIGDGNYDSAVFLKSGSFDAGGNASVDFIVNGDPDIDEVYEGCGTVQLVFDRVGGNINTPMPVSFTVTGTATPGQDYTPIPASVIIPPGQDKLILPINIISDLLTEGAESVIITLNSKCSCINPEEILIIYDLEPLTAVTDTVTVCGSGVGTVSVTPMTGVDPYTYQWQTGGTDATLSQFVAGSSNFRVTVTDGCGRTVVRTARINVKPLPTAQLLPPAPQICPGGTASIKINMNGDGPWSIVYNHNGNPVEIFDITDDPFTLLVDEPGSYQLISVMDVDGCTGPGQGALIVSNSTLDLTAVTSNIACAGQSNGSINTTVTGGQGPFTYAWQGPQNIPANMQDPINLIAGNYTVTVTDGFGCTDVIQATVVEPAPLTPSVASINEVTCAAPNGGGITLGVTGGTPNYTFAWSPGGSTAQSPNNLTAGDFTVTVTDSRGCTKTTSATVPSDTTPPVASAFVNDTLTCTTMTLQINGSASSSGSNFTYNWSANPGNIVSNGNTPNPTINNAGNYTLLVTNTQNGCTASTNVPVLSNTAPPIVNAGNDQTITCAVPNATLNGSATPAGIPYQYQWTAGTGGTIVSGGITPNPIVSAVGNYTLVVTNPNTGCTASDLVAVNSNFANPTAAITSNDLITCAITQVTLNGNNSIPANSLTYLWTTLNGNIVSGATTSSIVASEAGDYTLMVTNTQNGCTDTETVTVGQDFSDPTASVSVNGELNCNTQQLSLNGSAAANGSNFSFEWTTSPTGHFVSGINTLTPIVDAPGTYTLIVTNNVSNCTASASILIEEDRQLPVVSVGTPTLLTCAITEATLGPTTGGNPAYTYQWSTGNGNIVAGANTLNPTINQPGLYTLVVSDPNNGCTNTGSVTINQNIVVPTAAIAPAGQLTCTSPTLSLNGSGSSSGANFAYSWSSSTGGGIGSGASTLTPVVTAPGTYTLTVTNSQNGCSSTASVSVTNNASIPNAVAQSSGIITCLVDEVTLDASGSSSGPNFTYSWVTVGGQIVGPSNTSVITAGAPGLYTLVVTNTSNSCSATFSLPVNADITPPVADAGPAQTLNCTLPSQTLDGSGSSMNGSTYQWTSQSGSGFVSPTNGITVQVNLPGTYQLMVTNPSNGCTSIDNVVVIQDANNPIAAIADPQKLTCTTQQIMLDAVGSSTGATINYQWTANPGNIVLGTANALNAQVNAPGTYTLVVTNTANGCTSSQSVNVLQDVALPGANAGPDFILTCTTPEYQLGDTSNPTGVNFSYQWSGPGFAGGATTPTPTVNLAGNFTVTVTNTANGCTSTDVVAITADQTPPQANAGPGTQLSCTNTEYILQATGTLGAAIVYEWTTNTGSFTTPNNILTPTVNGAGNYQLVVTNTVNGCTASSTVTITQSADVPVAVVAVPSILTCNVTTVSLDGTLSSSGANFIYSWDLKNSGQGNIVSGNTTPTAVVNAPGVYILAVTDTSNACTSYTEVAVLDNVTPPDVDAGTTLTLTCTLPSVSLNGTVATPGNYSFLWQGIAGGNIVSGANTPTPAVNDIGIYQLTVTNLITGCTNTDNVEVIADQNDPVVSIANPGMITCAVKQLVLDATASTSVGNLTYSWSTADGHFVSQNNPLQPVVDKPGTYVLLIENIDNGCSSSNQVVVGQDLVVPVAQAGVGGTITCAVTSLQLDGSASSQNGNYFYQWTTIDGKILSGANSLTPTITQGGTYTLYVLNQDNGCQSSDNVGVNTNTLIPPAVISSPGLITCAIPVVTLSGVGSATGLNVTYSWSTVGGNIIGSQNSLNASANAAGQYVLTVFNTQTGCANFDTIFVVENNTPPIADAGTAATLTCTLNEVGLNGFASSGPIYTYVWSTVDGSIVSGINGLTPVVDEPGLYELLVSNIVTGCQTADTVIVTREYNVPNDLVYEYTNPSCSNNDASFAFVDVEGGVLPYEYSMDGGLTFYPDTLFENLGPGFYNLLIRDANGCLLERDFSIFPAPSISVNLIDTLDLTLGANGQLNAILPVGFSHALVDTVTWTPQSGLTFKGKSVKDLLTPVALPLQSTLYRVEVTTIDGCIAADEVFVRVDGEPHIYIPNAFSPWEEGDDNDKVVIYASPYQVKSVHRFQIFDRWGEMVFEQKDFLPNDPDYGWNGWHNGKIMSPAVFIYVAEVEFVDGKVLFLKGDVTLVR